MEENNKLKSRIMTLSNALRSNWSDEVRYKRKTGKERGIFHIKDDDVPTFRTT